MNTYSKENELNEVEMQKQKDIDLILELKKLKWALEQDGYIPTLDEAMARIARKWEKQDDEDETMESMMDDNSDEIEEPYEIYDDEGGYR